MTDQVPRGTRPLEKVPRIRDRRAIVLTLLIGIVIGILLSIVGTVIVFNLGFFDQFYVCPAPLNVEACPPEDALPPACPTCALQQTEAPKVIDLTPTPSEAAAATPDIGATATAACSTFQSQFPGTPCPETAP